LKEDIFGERLAKTSLTKPAILLYPLRAAVSKVILVYMNYGKTTSAKRKSGQEKEIIVF
jgi:hypothetical protein